MRQVTVIYDPDDSANGMTDRQIKELIDCVPDEEQTEYTIGNMLVLDGFRVLRRKGKIAGLMAIVDGKEYIFNDDGRIEDTSLWDGPTGSLAEDFLVELL